MTPRPPRLELTWIGKESRPRLEPRVLVETPEHSHHAAHRVGEADLFDNILIHGDNLLALKALEAEYAGKVKCVYIDPPFNTGAAFEHYDDSVEHSLWLGLMRDRFQRIKSLLSNYGVLVVHLDEREMAYAKVMLDEVFGRANYCNTVCMTTNDPSGFKATSATIFSTANYLLIYAKTKTTKPLRRTYIRKHYDSAYKYVLNDKNKPFQDWSWRLIQDVVSDDLGYETPKLAKARLGTEFDMQIADYARENADRVFRTAAVGGGH